MTEDRQYRKDVLERSAPVSQIPYPGAPGIRYSAHYATLLRGKILIGRCVLVVLSVAIALALIWPAGYTATASFIPPSGGNTSSAVALAGQLAGLGAGGLTGAIKSPGDVYVGILKSHSVAVELVRRFDLQTLYREKRESAAEKELAGNTAMNIGLKDGIVTLSVTDRSPQRACDLAAAYLEQLRTKVGNLALSESSQRRLFYEERLAKEKDDLANAEVALKQTQEHTGLIAPAGQTASQIQAVAQLRAQIAGRQVRLASLLHDETEQNPDVLRVRSEIADLQGQVVRMESGAGRIGFSDMSAAQVPGLELEYIRRTRDVKYHEALFEIIAKQYEAARLDEAHDPPLQVLDQPVVPDTRSSPHRAAIIGIGLIVGLLTGVLWVLFRAWQQGMRSSGPAG